MEKDEKRKAYQAEYYRKNKERLKEANRRWVVNNKERHKKVQAEYRAKNKDSIYKKQRGWVEANREKDAEYKRRHYESNKDEWRERTKRWVSKNQERTREIKRKNYLKSRTEKLRYTSEYQKKNRGHTREKVIYARIKKWTGIPPWVNREEIRDFYHKCPAGFVVDHMIPIRHTMVCGLHVLWNLQYLPKRENDAKGNKLLEKHMVCGS